MHTYEKPDFNAHNLLNKHGGTTVPVEVATAIHEEIPVEPETPSLAPQESEGEITEVSPTGEEKEVE